MYVQPPQLAKQLGKPNMVDPELDKCCQAATDQIDRWCGRIANFPNPIPATIQRVALSLAVDNWKQPDATFGIVGNGETGIFHQPRELVARYDAELIPYYEPVSTGHGGWGTA